MTCRIVLPVSLSTLKPFIFSHEMQVREKSEREKKKRERNETANSTAHEATID